MSKAVFLDKDGTLITNVHYNADPQKVKLAPFAGPALNRLQAAGYKLIVISNQSGIALGYFTERDLAMANEEMLKQLARYDVKIDRIYYCPHHEEAVVLRYAGKCSCRKPLPGMIARAVDELGIDAARSWMIGDIADDIEAGNKAGCKTILLADAEGKEANQTIEARKAHYLAINLYEASDIILSY